MKKIFYRGNEKDNLTIEVTMGGGLFAGRYSKTISTFSW